MQWTAWHRVKGTERKEGSVLQWPCCGHLTLGAVIVLITLETYGLLATCTWIALSTLCGATH